jgi:hypothetical protein
MSSCTQYAYRMGLYYTIAVESKWPHAAAAARPRPRRRAADRSRAALRYAAQQQGSASIVLQHDGQRYT